MKLVLPTIAVLFILAGCGGTGGGGAYYSDEETTTSAAASERTSAATEETTTSNNNVTATVRLTPMNGSTTTGTATFTDVAQGVVRVELSVLGLPDTNASTYLTHIHPGTCADEQSGDEEEQDSEHEHSDHEDTNEEIEYPLPPISADPQGQGFTSAVLDDVTVQQLFSGKPKYINVHAEGSGNPPALACGQLSMNIKSSAPSHPHS